MSSKGNGIFAGIFKTSKTAQALKSILFTEQDMTEDEDYMDYVSDTLCIEYSDGTFKAWYKHTGSNIRRNMIIYMFLKHILYLLATDDSYGQYVEIIDFFSYYYGENEDDIERDLNLPCNMDLYYDMHPLDVEFSIIKDKEFITLYQQVLYDLSPNRHLI